MTNPEILAPVGADEQLKAAVRNGANAVYFGIENFNARRNAANFGGESLVEAVKYCHAWNVKVYITLNTLVFDKELPELYDAVKEIAESSADAVIVQDFAAIKAVKELCPDLALHASTQMAVHNLSGAKLLENQGFSRVVLAREMSLDEIKSVVKNNSLETEVFVHGAHCMSASGNCYLSAILGDRSGNRGLCAQGCRLDWKSRERDHALSLKDMSYLEHINELKEAGVTSFKIEGRMKRPEYVAAAVKSLKSAVNGESYDSETLRSVFSRGGFTDGYLTGKRDYTMFGYRGKEDVTAAASVLKELSATYNSDIQVTPVNMEFTLKKNEPCTLKAKCGDIAVTAEGDMGEEPIKMPLSFDSCEKSLKKLGGTPFYLDKLVFNNPDSLTLPSSAINALRRECAEKLIYSITAVKRDINNITPPAITQYKPEFSTKLRARFAEFKQYSDSFSECEAVIFPIDEIINNKDKLKTVKPAIFAELPELIYPGSESKIASLLFELKELGISNGISGNIGGIKLLLDNGFTAHGAHGLNITNTPSLDFYDSIGLYDITLSFELSAKAIKALGGNTRRGAYVYGYLPLMLFRACPQKSKNGCNSCTGKSTLTDRKGIEFPLLCHNKEYSVLHNSVPLYVGDKNMPELDFYTLYFTKEKQAECSSVLEAVKKRSTIPGAKTNGIYFRELL